MIQKTCLALMLACALTLPVSAKSPSRLPIRACMNLGNHLEEPQENAWGGKRLEVQDFRDLKAAGFDTVRLPVRWDVHSAADGSHMIDPVWMARVTTLVDAALAAHLNVILNSHNFEPINTDPDGAAPWLADVWRQVARQFATRPRAHLWFEIENEPNGQLTNANLLKTLMPSLAAIRASNPDRPVVIGVGITAHWPRLRRWTCRRMPTSIRPSIIITRSILPIRAPVGFTPRRRSAAAMARRPMCNCWRAMWTG
jgi:endoglucanase